MNFSGQTSKHFPTLLQSSILIIFQILLYIAFLHIIAAIGALKYKNFSLLSNITVKQISYILSSIAIIIYSLKKNRQNLKSFFLTKPGFKFIIPVIPVLLIGYTILLSELNNIVRNFIFIPEPDLESILYSKSIAGLIIGCIFAPISEGIIYRGIILNGYQKNYNRIMAVLLSSLLYSLSQIELGKMFTTFIFGVLLSWLSIKTASLIYSIWAHIIINAINYAIYFNFIPYIRGFSPSPDNYGPHIQNQPLWFTLCGAVISVLSTWYFLKIISDCIPVINLRRKTK